ncbi:hypothetical protein AOLI_G00029690 [Acnodon oligacanthus]
MRVEGPLAAELKRAGEKSENPDSACFTPLRAESPEAQSEHSRPSLLPAVEQMSHSGTIRAHGKKLQRSLDTAERRSSSGLSERAMRQGVPSDMRRHLRGKLARLVPPSYSTDMPSSLCPSELRDKDEVSRDYRIMVFTGQSVALLKTQQLQ